MDAAEHPDATTLLLHGDYEYLTEGYYACQDAEEAGLHPRPTTADALDAYVVPIALERVALAGLPVPVWYLTNEFVTPPVLLYGVNPFARNHILVRHEEDRYAAARKISRQGKFVICAQELPPQATLVEFEQILDRSVDARFAEWADALYGLFHLPLARVRLIVPPSGLLLFSAIERLNAGKLTRAGRALFERRLHELNQRRG